MFSVEPGTGWPASAPRATAAAAPTCSSAPPKYSHCETGPRLVGCRPKRPATRLVLLPFFSRVCACVCVSVSVCVCVCEWVRVCVRVYVLCFPPKQLRRYLLTLPNGRTKGPPYRSLFFFLVNPVKLGKRKGNGCQFNLKKNRNFIASSLDYLLFFVHYLRFPFIIAMSVRKKIAWCAFSKLGSDRLFFLPEIGDPVVGE